MANYQVIITSAGMAEALSLNDRGLNLTIDTFKIGSGFGYTPDVNQTGLVGALRYTGPISKVVKMGNLRLDFHVILSNLIGDFTFGEVGIYTDTGVLFAIMVLTTPFEKVASSGSRTGNTYTTVFPIKFDNSVTNLNINHIQGVNALIAEVAGPWALPSPSEATTNAYMFQGGVNGFKTIAYLGSNDSTWYFTNYNRINSSIAVVGYDPAGMWIEVTADDVPIVTETGQLIFQVASGNIAGVAGVITSTQDLGIGTDNKHHWRLNISNAVLGLINGNAIDIWVHDSAEMWDLLAPMALLNKIKTVDGPGSGLDADMLDGLDSAVFARKDQANIFNSMQRIEGVGSEQLRVGENSAAGVSPLISMWNQSTRLAYLQASDTYLRLVRDGGALLSLEGSGVAKINNALVWTSANDGVASGLDADLLDGQHGSYYASLSYVDQRFADLVNSTSGTLTTLQALADALANDPNFSTTMMNELALKLNRSEYTAADVLAKVKSVDGSGSGLDADLLDGLDSTIFARKDQNNNFTATQIIAVAVSEQLRVGTGTDAATGTPMISMYRGAARSGYIQTNATDTRLVNEGGATTGILQVETSGVAKVNGNLIWHAGNDGASSGMDADLLDGVQGALFARRDQANTFTTTNTFNGTSRFNTLTYVAAAGNEQLRLGGGGATNPMLSLWNGDGNTRLGYISASPTGMTITREGGAEIALGDAGQIRINSNLVWTAGNDGAGSSLDADLLDGLHGNEYARLAVNNEFAGTLTTRLIRTSAPNSTQMQIGYGVTGISPTISFMEGTTQKSYLQDQTNMLLVASGVGGVLTIRGDGDARMNGSMIWHAGNDGAGSGLDADLLDGVNGASYARRDTTNTFGPEQTFDSRVLVSSAGVEQMRLGGSGALSPYMSFYGNAATRYGYLQASASEVRLQNEGGANLILTTTGNATINGNIVWTSGNDGAGSGLDADLLDGVQGLNFARRDVGNTMNGLNVFEGTDGSAEKLRIRENTPTGNPALTFYRGSSQIGSLTASNSEVYLTNPGGAMLRLAGIGDAYVNSHLIWHNGDAAVSKAQNGYQKLPSGLIIQWGRAHVPQGDITNTVSFPITFPTACLNVSITDWVQDDPDWGATFQINAVSGTWTKTYFKAATSNSQGSEFYWMAIGY